MASNGALPKKATTEEIRSRYLNYLEQLSKSENKIVQGGALFRLFKENVNAGNWAQATLAKDSICKLSKDQYRIDIENLDIENILNFNDYATYNEKYPAWCGCILFYLGMYYANGQQNLPKRLRFFQQAVQVLEHEIDMAPQYTLEPKSLLENAQYHFSQALLMSYVNSIRPIENWPKEWANRIKFDVINYSEQMKEISKVKQDNKWLKFKRAALLNRTT